MAERMRSLQDVLKIHSSLGFFAKLQIRFASMVADYRSLVVGQAWYLQ